MIANRVPRDKTQFYVENYVNNYCPPGSDSSYVMLLYCFQSMFRVAFIKVGKVSKDSCFSSPSNRIFYRFGE